MRNAVITSAALAAVMLLMPRPEPRAVMGVARAVALFELSYRFGT